MSDSNEAFIAWMTGRINRLEEEKVESEKLAGLVMIARERFVQTDPTIIEIIRLAREIAPKDVDRCACKLPGLSVGSPDVCPICDKPHRL
jgi:hypothetical protein